jgi:nucleotide-binding universal stress UspA family protein
MATGNTVTIAGHVDCTSGDAGRRGSWLGWGWTTAYAAVSVTYRRFTMPERTAAATGGEGPGHHEPAASDTVVLDGKPGTAAPGDSLVVGFDRRAKPNAALQEAVALGRRLQAAIHVVHAVSLSDYPIDPDRADWEEEGRRVLAEERGTVAAALAGYEGGWSYRVTRGDAAEALIGAADELDALMIVVGTRGEGWKRLLDRLTTPSVSHRVIRGGGRPVLVVADGSHQSHT